MKFSTLFSGILIISTLCTAKIVARDAIYESEDYSINLSYSDSVNPGDAVFVRLKLTAGKGLKRSKESVTQAKAVILSKKKEISHADFFNTTPSKKNGLTVELFSGIPLSSWLESGNYTLTVVYTPFGMNSQEFSLPIVVNEKQFVEEEIPLSESNTNIRTDTSAERLAQIEKLNNLYAKKDLNSVYSFSNFQLPVSSTRRTSGFADRRTYLYSTGKKATSLHYGIDFGVPTGTEVLACSGGKIVMAENRISTGWSVVIEHLPGLYSIYYHLSKLDVSENQMIKKGEKIGLSGATGMVTGPHLHWEIRLNGEAVNPDLFLEDFSFLAKKN